MINETNPTSALAVTEGRRGDETVVFMAQNHGTGIRQDDELIAATEMIHRFTSEGRGILINPSDIARARLANRDSWTTAQLADTEFEVRRALLPAIVYDRGNGRRLEGTMLMPLNTDDGCHATDVDYIAFVNLEGTIAGNMVGRYGCFRINPMAVDKRGVLHEIALNDRGYLDARTIHPAMLEGFIEGYAHLEGACDDADNIRRALTTIRNASRASDQAEEREFIDRTAPRTVGF